jgi:mono/diheme cytochrome c family protein
MIETATRDASSPGRRAAAPFLAAVLGSALTVAGGAAAQSPEHAVERGALLYRIHCANCHGDAGDGDGPMADVLCEAPTDLTRLARAAGGTFPADAVRGAIDGREAVRGHGRREMPVWGLTFQERGRDTDQEAEVRGRIDDLLAFLRSIQDGAADGEAEQGGGEADRPAPPAEPGG